MGTASRVYSLLYNRAPYFPKPELSSCNLNIQIAGIKTTLDYVKWFFSYCFRTEIRGISMAAKRKEPTRKSPPPSHNLTPELVETTLLLADGHSASAVGDLLGFGDSRTAINRRNRLAEITGGNIVEYSKITKRHSLTEHGKRIQGELLQFLSLAQQLSDRSRAPLAMLHLPQHTGFVAPALNKFSAESEKENEVVARVLGEECNDRNNFITRAVHQLFSGKYDLIIGHDVDLTKARREGNDTHHINHRYLYDSFLSVLVKKDMAKNEVVYLSDLVDYQLLVPPEGTRSRSLLNSLATKESVTINPVRQTYESKVLVSLAHEGMGLPILSSDAAAQFDYENAGEFAGEWLSDYRWLPLASQNGEIVSVPVHATWRNDKNIKLISKMVAILCEESAYLRTRYDDVVETANSNYGS